MRAENGMSRVTKNATVRPVPYACAQQSHAVAAMDSCSGLVRSYQHGCLRVEMGLTALSCLLITAKACPKHPFKRQLRTTHVEDVGWEPHGSSPTARAKRVDQP